MKLLHLVPLCGAVALLAACGPKPTTPPVPEPTPTMKVLAQPTPTPEGTVSPMPSPTATPLPPAAAAPAGTPDLGSGPMTTPDTENTSDKSLIAPPTSIPGNGGTSSDPTTR